jgi:two-component system OmpR family sensor kinase
VLHAFEVSLRLRLVLGLVTLLVLGLGAFGIATYSLYAPSQYQRLDDQLDQSVPFVSTQLYAKAGIHVAPGGSGPGGGPSGGPTGSGGPGPGSTGSDDTTEPGNGGPQGPGGQQLTTPLPPGTFAELLTSASKVRSSLQYLASSDVRPRLPDPLGAVGKAGRIFTTGSSSGSTSWQVLVRQAPGLPGDVVVIAIPSSSVNGALHKLLLIELGVAAGLLALLSAGSWLVLRRGLRPLEDMATTARSIAGGDLSQRVGHEQGPAEIAQLGQAIDTMLSDIETAFAERAASEQRLRRSRDSPSCFASASIASTSISQPSSGASRTRPLVWEHSWRTSFSSPGWISRPRCSTRRWISPSWRPTPAATPSPWRRTAR